MRFAAGDAPDTPAAPAARRLGVDGTLVSIPAAARSAALAMAEVYRETTDVLSYTTVRDTSNAVDSCDDDQSFYECSRDQCLKNKSLSPHRGIKALRYEHMSIPCIWQHILPLPLGWRLSLPIRRKI